MESNQQQDGNMIQIPVQFTKVNLLADRSVSILLHTNNEINNEDLIELLDHRGLLGWMLFKEDKEIDIDEVPKEQSGITKKSIGQKERKAYFVEFTLKGGEKEDFNVWYDKFREARLEKKLQQINELQ